MKMRLAKFIADSGFASRREAEKLITDGVVFVDNKKITTPVFFVDGTEQIIINGKIISKNKDGLQIYLFHKPINTITSRSDPNGRKTIYDILPKRYKNLKYVGRLDYKTTGLLLLTNDGEFARKMTLPDSDIKRVYIATLHPKKITEIKSPSRSKALREFLSPLNSEDKVFDILRSGAIINGVKYEPMDIQVLSRYPIKIQITLTEGKKNEIRITMNWLGFMVKKLHRISYGKYHLGDLSVGKIKKI
ncbi:MAG: rRNA pseudouridine synthase [Alphaproteobacteria bacterium]|nr:rRNA pseudouridine synthase [Alphaproteobacteria bacterium]